MRREAVNHRLVALVVAVASALAVAACGSSSSNSPSSSSAGAASSSSGGAPIKLMTMGPISSPQFSLPSIPVGAQIAINKLNASGGINGHKVQLIACNDQNNPNTAAQCAREAIKDKVTALVGGLEDYDLQIEPLLNQAGIPWVGLTTADDYTTPNLFLFGGQGVDGFAAAGMTLAQHGCKKIAIIVTAAAGTQKINAADIAAGVQAGGAKVATTITIPATAVDLAPTVAAARASGADCIASGASPSQSGPLITALGTGPKLKLAVVSGGLPNVLLNQLGKPADGVLATAGFLPATSTEGAVPQLVKTMKAQYPKVPFDQFAETGYAAVNLIADAVKGQGDVSSSSVMSALSKVNGYNTGVGPVATFTAPNPIPGYPRLFNPKDFVWVAKNGNYSLSQPQPIDTTPALKLLSAK
jgi:ABC-type branched-subunit amino acid transport system substrate-binding protein